MFANCAIPLLIELKHLLILDAGSGARVLKINKKFQLRTRILCSNALVSRRNLNFVVALARLNRRLAGGRRPRNGLVAAELILFLLE